MKSPVRIMLCNIRIWLFIGSLVLFTCKGKKEKVTAHPPFDLLSTSGEEYKLGDYRGHVTIVNFWATWCAPCLNEIPRLIKIYNKNKNRGLVVLGISLEEKSLLTGFVDEYKITYPILLGTNELYQVYNVKNIPRTLFFDKKGRIRKIQEGYAPQLTPILESLVDSLLAE